MRKYLKSINRDMMFSGFGSKEMNIMERNLHKLLPVLSKESKYTTDAPRGIKRIVVFLWPPLLPIYFIYFVRKRLL